MKSNKVESSSRENSYPVRLHAHIIEVRIGVVLHAHFRVRTSSRGTICWKYALKTHMEKLLYLNIITDINLEVHDKSPPPFIKFHHDPATDLLQIVPIPPSYLRSLVTSLDQFGYPSVWFQKGKSNVFFSG